jgi:hypothetical protein
MTLTLSTPPIQLTPHEPLTSPILGSLPLSTMGTATQESDAPQTVTPSVSYRVAETQEPVTHSVAETQEPAMAETQKTATVETQEPVTDIEIELQDSDAQTSFVFNKEAGTQSAIYPVAETQEPASPRIQKGIPTDKKDVQTLPTEGLTPPSQINPSTSREQFTQTPPGPTASDAET